MQNGLADAIGDRQAAIERAADEAELDSYDVRVLRPDGQTFRFVSRNNYLGSDAPNKEMVDFEYFAGEPGTGPTFLMMPGAYVSTEWQLSAAGGSMPTDSDATSESLTGASGPISADSTANTHGTPRTRADAVGGPR